VRLVFLARRGRSPAPSTLERYRRSSSTRMFRREGLALRNWAEPVRSGERRCGVLPTPTSTHRPPPRLVKQGSRARLLQLRPRGTSRRSSSRRRTHPEEDAVPERKGSRSTPGPCPLRRGNVQRRWRLRPVPLGWPQRNHTSRSPTGPAPLGAASRTSRGARGAETRVPQRTWPVDRSHQDPDHRPHAIPGGGEHLRQPTTRTSRSSTARGRLKKTFARGASSIPAFRWPGQHLVWLMDQLVTEDGSEPSHHIDSPMPSTPRGSTPPIRGHRVSLAASASRLLTQVGAPARPSESRRSTDEGAVSSPRAGCFGEGRILTLPGAPPHPRNTLHHRSRRRGTLGRPPRRPHR